MKDKNFLNNIKDIAKTTKEVLPMTTNKIDGTLSIVVDWIDKENLPAIEPTLHVKNMKMYIPEALPEWFIKCDLSDNIFQISSSILHLAKFGISNLLEDKWVTNVNYNYLLYSIELSRILNDYKKMYDKQEFEIQSTKGAIMVNDYGRQFAKTCL